MERNPNEMTCLLRDFLGAPFHPKSRVWLPISKQKKREKKKGKEENEKSNSSNSQQGQQQIQSRMRRRRRALSIFFSNGIGFKSNRTQQKKINK
jgi:hypothetical protein